MKRFIVAAVLGAALITPRLAHGDVVRDWNRIAASLPAPNPFAQARTLAITQLAVFEAVNAITAEYERYLENPIVAPDGASADAAAVQAAYRVLITLLPAAATTLNNERTLSLAAIPDDAAKADGVAVGEAAAAAMLALRANDGATALPNLYFPTSTDAGQWQPTTGVNAAGLCTAGVLFQWQHLQPFAVPNVRDFMATPPPSLDSSQYAKDYAEVQTVGSAVSTARPPDRADVVRFYAASSPGYLFNSVARQLAEAQGRSMSHTARALALITMATSDSLVASFASKYEYKQWRPETAIRFGATDGNDKTSGDVAFTTFINTPCFPSYPSNHASGSNGAAEMIRRIYGAGEHAIELTNTAVPSIAGIILHYDTLQAICNDIDDARVYGGIHFRFDQDAGTRLGRNVATYVIRNWLRPLHGN
jgi:hypothetical protein